LEITLNPLHQEEGLMPSIIGVLVALVVAVVVLWLLDMAIPGAIAALIALLIFLWLVFGGGAERFGRFGGPRVGTGTRY
jgi:hypothetical protein